LDDALKLAKQHGLRLGADDLLHDLSVLEDVQSRDLEYTVVPDGRRVLVGVQLDDGQLVGVLVRDLLKDGGDLTARPAPLGPEVDEYGLVALEDLALEGRVGNVLDGGHGYLLNSPGRPASARR